MKSLLTSLEAEAGMALDYMAVNKLVANTEKTKFLLIRGKRHNKWPEVKIKVGNPLVNESQSEKILGVTVNNNLMWKEQHSNIANTLREYKQPILKRLAYHLPRWVGVAVICPPYFPICQRSVLLPYVRHFFQSTMGGITVFAPD
jgi:hypothetical protein